MQEGGERESPFPMSANSEKKKNSPLHHYSITTSLGREKRKKNGRIQRYIYVDLGGGGGGIVNAFHGLDRGAAVELTLDMDSEGEKHTEGGSYTPTEGKEKSNFTHSVAPTIPRSLPRRGKNRLWL